MLLLRRTRAVIDNKNLIALAALSISYQGRNRNYHTQLSLELDEVIQKAHAALCVLSPDWKRSIWPLKFRFRFPTKHFLLQKDVQSTFLCIAKAPGNR